MYDILSRYIAHGCMPEELQVCHGRFYITVGQNGGVCVLRHACNTCGSMGLDANEHQHPMSMPLLTSSDTRAVSVGKWHGNLQLPSLTELPGIRCAALGAAGRSCWVAANWCIRASIPHIVLWRVTEHSSIGTEQQSR